MSRLTLFLGMIAAGLVLLIVNHNSGQTLGLPNNDFASLVYLLPLATLLGAGILASRERLGQNLKYLGIWTLLALALVTIYLYRDDARDMGTRLAAELMPGSPFVLTTANGGEEVVIRKRRNGHFFLTASLDGVSVPMLVDTGASRIALSYRDAERIGLKPETLSFSERIQTANGQTMAAPVNIPTVMIGPVVRRNVAASVTPEGAMGESLLGMNFLSSLSSIRIEPDEMRLVD